MKQTNNKEIKEEIKQRTAWWDKKKTPSFLEPIKEMEWWYWLLDTKSLKWHTFKYDEHEIFYRNDVPTVSSFYWWRIALVVIWMLVYVFPWLLLLVALFWQKKPRNRCLLVSKEWIWKIDKPWSFSSKGTYFLPQEEVGDILIEWDKISIKKKWKNSKYFSFSNILETEKLKYSFKKHWYNYED